jgi:hypothetical protein
MCRAARADLAPQRPMKCLIAARSCGLSQADVDGRSLWHDCVLLKNQADLVAGLMQCGGDRLAADIDYRRGRRGLTQLEGDFAQLKPTVADFDPRGLLARLAMLDE